MYTRNGEHSYIRVMKPMRKYSTLRYTTVFGVRIVTWIGCYCKRIVIKRKISSVYNNGRKKKKKQLIVWKDDVNHITWNVKLQVLRKTEQTGRTQWPNRHDRKWINDNLLSTKVLSGTLDYWFHCHLVESFVILLCCFNVGNLVTFPK